MAPTRRSIAHLVALALSLPTCAGFSALRGAHTPAFAFSGGKGVAVNPRPHPYPTQARSSPPTRRPRRGPAPLQMCGILAIVNSKLSEDDLRLKTLTLQRLVRHRGPDGSGVHVVRQPGTSRATSVAHERLAIVDPLSGNQPLYSDDRRLCLTVNGEIYNHQELKRELKNSDVFRTESDCEVCVGGVHAVCLRARGCVCESVRVCVGARVSMGACARGVWNNMKQSEYVRCVYG